MRARILLLGTVVALGAGVAAIARAPRQPARSAVDVLPRTRPTTSTNPLDPTPPTLYPPLPSPAEGAGTPGSAILAVQASPLGEKSPSRNLDGGHSSALHDAIVAATPTSARLYVAFARAGVPTPPEAKTLVQMKQAGAPADELVTYVKTSFPHDLLTRAVALRWLGAAAGAGARLVPTPNSTPIGAQLMRGDGD